MWKLGISLKNKLDSSFFLVNRAMEYSESIKNDTESVNEIM